MEMVPDTMITIRMIRMIRTSSKYRDVLDDDFSTKDPMYHIFLKTLGNMQVNGVDPIHQDPNQEDQDDQDILQVQGHS